MSTRPRVLTPLVPDGYKVQFAVTRDTHDTLRQVQDLLRHSVPDGDMASIFDRAFAAGGPTTEDNLQLRCRAHNAPEASEYFVEPDDS